MAKLTKEQIRSTLKEARKLAREGQHLGALEGGGQFIEATHKLEEAVDMYAKVVRALLRKS